MYIYIKHYYKDKNIYKTTMGPNFVARVYFIVDRPALDQKIPTKKNHEVLLEAHKLPFMIYLALALLAKRKEQIRIIK